MNNPSQPAAAVAPPATQGGLLVTITNQLTIPVDIFDVFNPGSLDQPAPFQYTKLGTIAANSTSAVTTIRNAALLQAMTTGAISELNNLYYYQFPIKFMSGTQIKYGTPPPLTYTIADADRTATIQSFLFHKFAMANPSSALTTNLNTAIKTGNAATINEFFAKTQHFTACTLASWNAIMTWLQQFTSGWQGPYYLYEKAPSTIPKGYVPNLRATLNIVSDAQNNVATLRACTADDSGNPIYDTAQQPTTVVMTGNGQMADANPGVDITLSLTPVWMNVIQSTDAKSVPSYLIGSGVCGTFAGVEVVSSQTARQIPGKPADPKKTGFFDSLFGSASSTLSTLVGLIMLYEFLSKMGSKKDQQKETAKDEAKSDQDLKDKTDAIEKETQQETKNELTSQEATTTFQDAPKQVQSEYAESATALQKETLNQAIDEQVDAINQEVSNQLNEGATPTQEFEDSWNTTQQDLTTAQQNADAGDLDGAQKSLNDATTTMDTAVSKQGSEMAEWESTALSDSAEALQKASADAQDIDKGQQEAEETRSSETDDSGAGTEESAPETDPIEL